MLIAVYLKEYATKKIAFLCTGGKKDFLAGVYPLYEYLKKYIEDKFILAKIRQKAEDSLRDKIEICDLEESVSIVQETSADFDFRMFKKEHIFPLKRGCFEGLEIWLPNEPDKILQECYGDYMSFPKDINHHSDMFLNFTEGEIDAAISALEKI